MRIIYTIGPCIICFILMSFNVSIYSFLRNLPDFHNIIDKRSKKLNVILHSGDPNTFTAIRNCLADTNVRIFILTDDTGRFKEKLPFTGTSIVYLFYDTSFAQQYNFSKHAIFFKENKMLAGKIRLEDTISIKTLINDIRLREKW